MYVQNAHMAPAPIVIKCECGVETRGRSGGLIGILGLAGLAKFGTYGLVGGALIGAVLWYVLFMPWQKRRMLRKATALYTPTVAPTRK